jgi:hypothetical protein
MRTIIATAVAALCLSACATAYQDRGLTGGLTASRMDATTMQITARGNGFTDSATIREHVVLRAAEETLKAGFGHYQIVGASNQNRAGTWATPGHTYRTTTGSATAHTLGGTTLVSGSAYTQTTYVPGQVFTYEKPGLDIVVKMFPGPKPAGARDIVFDAQEVLTYLGPKYGRLARAADR